MLFHANAIRMNCVMEILLFVFNKNPFSCGFVFIQVFYTVNVLFPCVFLGVLLSYAFT